MKTRLLQFIETIGISQNAFEDKCGLTRGTITKLNLGLRTDKLAQIADAFPSLNLRWLLLGEGSMKKTINSDEPNMLPLIPLEAMAGPGTPVYEDERDVTYYSVQEFKDSDFLIRVKGDSMVPKFTGGDVVACKKISLDKLFFLQWGRVYVLYTDSQGVMIKRVEQSEKEGHVKCVSENKKYSPFDVPMSDIISLALVSGSISLE